MVDLSTTLRYYKQEEIQKAMLCHSKNKEVAVSFNMKGFGKRPDTLTYPRDILEFVKQGATSFHCSEELWKNPLQLNPALKHTDLNELRAGWDLILDIDCPFLDYSGIAADLLVRALKYHGVESVSVKFSGNHGFHIAVPFEAFPEKVNDIPTKNLFPDGPKKIALYLKEMIRDHLSENILKREDLDKVLQKTGKKFDEVIKDGKFDPFMILSIDTILISSRHLYRMPYSLNEKSGLVSIPIDPSRILEFSKESAHPDKVSVSNISFLDRSKARSDEARKLIVQALDFEVKTAEGDEKLSLGKKREFEVPQMALKEDFFPPCIKHVLKGLEDGKKRSLFVLTNFLSNVGWDYDKIEVLLKEWNKRNPEPLREVYILGHVRYSRRQAKKVLPPNCDNKGYYQDMHLCKPDSLCQKIKNPVNYAIRKTYFLNDGNKGKEGKIRSEKAAAGKSKKNAEQVNPAENCVQGKKESC